MTTIESSVIADYMRQTPRSQQQFESAKLVLPGGVSRTTLAFQPYPFYSQRAAGARVVDLDGNNYLDLVNNYTSLAHGHGHPATTRAAIAELSISSASGVAHPAELEYARDLRQRLPAMERLHFTTTGSEAVGFAVRVARANTGRSRVLKFEGAFHGSHNELYQDISCPPMPNGSARPSRPASAGLDASSTITAIFNDVASVREAFARFGTEIAAVTVEPFLGNSALILAQQPFLDAVFDLAAANGALVIFDEIQSLRAGVGGAQGIWGYRPDLVTIGKIVGGGYPLAAFGGRADLMTVLSDGELPVLQTGTFTAATAYLAAGRASMQALGITEYSQLETKTERLRVGIRDEFGAARIPVHVNGVGSMFNIAISEEPVHSYRVHRKSDTARLATFRLEMLIRGVLIMTRGTGCLSTAVTNDDVDSVIATVREALRVIA